MNSSHRQIFLVAGGKDLRTSHRGREPVQKPITVVQVKDRAPPRATGGVDETLCGRGQSDKYHGSGEEMLDAGTQ